MPDGTNLLHEKPAGDRKECADEESPQGWVIKRQRSPLTFRSDKTPREKQGSEDVVKKMKSIYDQPEDRGGEESVEGRASELFGIVRSTYCLRFKEQDLDTGL